ncbi:restriction endonuclease subunit S [Chryseobacterium sp. A301]
MRFNEFYEEWEVQGLHDVLVKFDKTTTINNQYPILTSARTGIYFQKDYFDGNEVASKDNTGYNIVPRGYFTYRHMSDDVTFKFNINTICDKGIVSTLYPVFTTSGVNDYFLKTYLNEGQAFKNYALLQKQGGSRTYMYYNKLSKLKLPFPTLSEQNKISRFLSSIDAKIQAEKNILDKYQSQKQYLLQNLFI